MSYPHASPVFLLYNIIMPGSENSAIRQHFYPKSIGGKETTSRRNKFFEKYNMLR